MLHRSGEMGKKPYLNNFIFIVKIPNLEPKVFTVLWAEIHSFPKKMFHLLDESLMMYA